MSVTAQIQVRDSEGHLWLSEPMDGLWKVTIHQTTPLVNRCVQLLTPDNSTAFTLTRQGSANALSSAEPPEHADALSDKHTDAVVPGKGLEDADATRFNASTHTMRDRDILSLAMDSFAAIPEPNGAPEEVPLDDGASLVEPCTGKQKTDDAKDIADDHSPPSDPVLASDATATLSARIIEVEEELKAAKSEGVALANTNHRYACPRISNTFV